PRNSPAWTVRLTRSTAPMSAASVRYDTDRLSTSSSGSGTSLSHRPESGIADLIEGVVDEREPGAQERDGCARRQRPPRVARFEGTALLRVVQHRAPGQLGAVPEPEELEAGRKSDDEHGEAEKGGDDQGRPRRNDLKGNDVEGF